MSKQDLATESHQLTSLSECLAPAVKGCRSLSPCRRLSPASILPWPLKRDWYNRISSAHAQSWCAFCS